MDDCVVVGAVNVNDCPFVSLFTHDSFSPYSAMLVRLEQLWILLGDDRGL